MRATSEAEAARNCAVVVCSCKVSPEWFSALTNNNFNTYGIITTYHEYIVQYSGCVKHSV